MFYGYPSSRMVLGYANNLGSGGIMFGSLRHLTEGNTQQWTDAL